MYLHLGKNVVVAHSEIIAICDLDNSSHSHITRAFLSAAEKNGQVVNISDDLPKSFVICQRPDGSQVLYLSQLASSTLLKRAGTLSIE